jgi:hypothetical protein
MLALADWAPYPTVLGPCANYYVPVTATKYWSAISAQKPRDHERNYDRWSRSLDLPRKQVRLVEYQAKPPSSVARIPHGYDNIALLVSGVDISVRFGGLFHRIAAIDNGFQTSVRDDLAEEDEILRFLPAWWQSSEGDGGLFATDHRGPRHLNKDGERGDGCEMDPAFLQRALAARERALPHGVEDDIVGLPALCKRSRVYSTTVFAPSDLTNSTFAVLHTPVTSAPKYFASCTAAVPTLPEAPL